MRGFFEAQPGSGNYVFSAPMFPKAVITQPDGTRLTLNAPGAKASTIQYIDTLSVAGEKTGRSWISHHDLLSAGTVNFRLTTDGRAARGAVARRTGRRPCQGRWRPRLRRRRCGSRRRTTRRGHGTEDPVRLTAGVTEYVPAEGERATGSTSDTVVVKVRRHWRASGGSSRAPVGY